jgi:hypothetical protein
VSLSTSSLLSMSLIPTVTVTDLPPSEEYSNSPSMPRRLRLLETIWTACSARARMRRPRPGRPGCSEPEAAAARRGNAAEVVSEPVTRTVTNSLQYYLTRCDAILVSVQQIPSQAHRHLQTVNCRVPVPPPLPGGGFSAAPKSHRDWRPLSHGEIFRLSPAPPRDSGSVRRRRGRRGGRPQRLGRILCASVVTVGTEAPTRRNLGAVSLFSESHSL